MDVPNLKREESVSYSQRGKGLNIPYLTKNTIISTLTIHRPTPMTPPIKPVGMLLLEFSL